jgi:hypothetical protein
MTRSPPRPGNGVPHRACSPVIIDLDPPVTDERLLAEWDQRMKAVEREQETARDSLHRLLDRIGELALILTEDDGSR